MGKIEPVSFGLFGEVGSVLAVVKKHERDGPKVRSWSRVFVEELADVLWYFATLSRRLGVDLDQLFLGGAPVDAYGSVLGYRSAGAPPNRRLGDSEVNVRLGEAAAKLLGLRVLDEAGWEALRTFGSCYIRVVAASGLTLEEIIQVGIRKAHDGFVLPPESRLPRFDVGFPEGERLPEHFEITFTQRADGRCEMVWDDATVGDPL